MKRFVFPLERVRQWRQTQVDLELAKLQALFQQLTRLQDGAALLARAVQNAERELEAEAGKGKVLQPLALTALDNYRLYAKREQAELAQQQWELGRQITDQRKRLIDARRDFQLLEKLRERARAAWERENDREIDALAGELHLAKWKPRRKARVGSAARTVA